MVQLDNLFSLCILDIRCVVSDLLLCDLDYSKGGILYIASLGGE